MSPDLELAHRLADLADAISHRYFIGEFEVETKQDGSPVTIADRTVEQTIKDTLAVERPDDGILGEEVGPSGRQDRRWILDGIDGTHNFAAGRTEWGTLIARQVDGEVVLGVVTSPALGRRWWAERDGGAWTAALTEGGLGPAEQLRCSGRDELAAAVVSVIPGVGFYKEPGDWRVRVVEAVHRGDVQPTAFGHSALRVAAGESDATVHLYGGVWDHAVGAVIVEEAGGRFADLWGGRRLDTNAAVYTNAPLFEPLTARIAEVMGDGVLPPDPLP